MARRPPPPPRHTDPPAADRAAPGAHDRPATLAECVYQRGVRRRRRGAERGPRATPQGRGVGNSGATPPPFFPPLPPPACEPWGRRPSTPPEAGETSPNPPEGTVTPGGERS